MSHVPTITALMSARLLQTLADAGHDWETEARRAGVPVDLTPEFARRVAMDRVDALFARGAVLCGPDFPLMARTPKAEDNRSPLTMYGRTRATVREGLAAVASIWDRTTDAYRLVLDGDVLRWHGARRPAMWWFDVADMLSNIRSVFGRGPYFDRIRAPFPAPPGAPALFGCRIEPGPSFEVCPTRTLLSARLPPVDPAIRAHVEREIAALSPPEPSGPSLVTTLWALGPTATLADLAEATQTSERTVHRRLAEAGTSFRAERDAMRAKLAADLAASRSTEEVAEALGYSDGGAYRRAARRWTARS